MNIFDRIFGRSRVPRDVDSLIRDIADHQRQKDYSEFIHLLPGFRLFLPLAAPLPYGIPSGQEIIVRPEMKICMKTASVQGLECALAFTSASHPDLGSDYVGMDGREVLAVVDRLSGMDGLLVQSTGTAWVVLGRQNVADALRLA